VVGGIAEQIVDHLKSYFPNVEVLYPIFNQQYVNPIYGNAVAFYIIGVNIYE
jgi:plasmid segregation protein ParM